MKIIEFLLNLLDWLQIVTGATLAGPWQRGWYIILIILPD
jgi:hypothetical protein